MTVARDPVPRLRRTLNRAERRIDTQVDLGDGWNGAVGPGGVFTIPHAFTTDFELARYESLGLTDGTVVLPVCPASFRAFMLSEDHAVAAARGMARRFIPAGYRVAAAYEAVTHRTFPPFRPNSLWYRQPVYYMANALTLVPSGIPVSAPSYSEALDFELELGVVLARPLRDATVEQAAAAIGAVVVINDFSARDRQLAEMRSGFGPQKSKHFLTSMSSTAAGPAIVDRLDRLSATVVLNDETISRPTTQGMRYSMAEAIAHASRSEQLQAGELFSSGTLTGGSGMEMDVWLAPGDRLRLEIDGVGVIEHRISE